MLPTPLSLSLTPLFTCCSGIQATKCDECGAGYFSDSKASECDHCPKGKYASTEGTAICSACKEGKYNNDIGQQQCSDCIAGKWSKSGEKECSDCAAGKTSSDGAYVCSDCPAGKSAVVGSSLCTPCEEGKHSATTGWEECKSCEDGYYCGVGSSSPKEHACGKDDDGIAEVSEHTHTHTNEQRVVSSFRATLTRLRTHANGIANNDAGRFLRSYSFRRKTFTAKGALSVP